MNSRTSGRFSCSHCCTGRKPAKIGAQTGSACFFASSAKPIVGVCDEPIPPTILAMFDYLAAPGWGQSSRQIELLVDRDVVLAAVRLVVIHEEEDVRSLDEFALVVVPLDRALQPAEELHTGWVIRHQRVRQPRGLVDERPGC